MENKKINLEIKELEKPWYFKPDYLKIILTFIIALGTLIFTFCSGILDKRKENLRLEKNILILEIADFQNQKENIYKEINTFRDSLNLMKTILISAQDELSKSYKNQEKLNIEKLSKDETIKYYKKQLDSLTTLIIQTKSIRKVLTDEHGRKLTDENGNLLTF